MTWTRRGPIVLASLMLLELLSSSLGAQIPLSSSPIATPGPLIDVDVGQWNLSVGPSADSTSHLVFDTVASLLQEWPNTRYRNGAYFYVGLSRNLTN